MRISDWSSDVCSSDLSVTARDSISSTGATKLTSRNSSSGATSAITHQRRGAENLARDPGIESLRELVAILDPEIGIEFQRVGHVRRVAWGVLFQRGGDELVGLDTCKPGRNKARRKSTRLNSSH